MFKFNDIYNRYLYDSRLSLSPLDSEQFRGNEGGHLRRRCVWAPFLILPTIVKKNRSDILAYLFSFNLLTDKKTNGCV